MKFDRHDRAEAILEKMYHTEDGQVSTTFNLSGDRVLAIGEWRSKPLVGRFKKEWEAILDVLLDNDWVEEYQQGYELTLEGWEVGDELFR